MVVKLVRRKGNSRKRLRRRLRGIRMRFWITMINVGILLTHSLFDVYILKDTSTRIIEKMSLPRRLPNFGIITTTASESNNLHYRNCTYEGNCPALSYCGTSGICLPYLSPQMQSQMKPLVDASSNSNDCFSKCFYDANLDEQYHFEMEIMWDTVRAIEHTPNPAQGPSGCVLVYQKSTYVSPMPSSRLIQRWKNQQHKHKMVVRRDALPTQNNQKGEQHQQQWAVLCYNPCRTDQDCYNENHPEMTTNDTAYFQCTKSGTCERHNKETKSNYALFPHPKKDTTTSALSLADAKKLNLSTDLVVISYADYRYMPGLAELAASLRYWAPHVKLCVYNLGLKANDIKTIEGWSNVVDIVWKEGFPESIPKHAREGKVYAWKPIAVAQAAKRFGKVLVLDAGSVVLGPLDPIEMLLERDGYFVVRGQDHDFKKRAHPGTFQALGFNKNTFVGGGSYGGNTVGFLYPSDMYDKLVVDWVDCASTKECIQPEGSKLNNHRYDQTALSILSYRYHVLPQPHTELLRSTKPSNWSPWEPEEKIVWTARQSSSVYSKAEKQGGVGTHVRTDKSDRMPRKTRRKTRMPRKTLMPRKTQSAAGMLM